MTLLQRQDFEQSRKKSKNYWQIYVLRTTPNLEVSRYNSMIEIFKDVNSRIESLEDRNLQGFKFSWC